MDRVQFPAVGRTLQSAGEMGNAVRRRFARKTMFFHPDRPRVVGV